MSGVIARFIGVKGMSSGREFRKRKVKNLRRYPLNRTK